MRKINKFIFTCLIAVILFTPISFRNVPAAEEEIVEQSAAPISSHIWPYYGKMVIFSEIMFTFMLFSFIAPLAHFYIKGEKHH
ncbi:MAG: hypothetical protein PHX78_02205 [bacterium]|nr:hypothetical protein [bacterium]